MKKIVMAVLGIIAVAMFMPQNSAGYESPYMSGERIRTGDGNNDGSHYGTGEHTGLDFYCIDFNIGAGEYDSHIPILAMEDGIAGGGIYYTYDVVLEHANNEGSGYVHLSERFVQKGQKVKTGQVIGLTGGEGGYPSHLHGCRYDSNGQSIPLDGMEANVSRGVTWTSSNDSLLTSLESTPYLLHNPMDTEKRGSEETPLDDFGGTNGRDEGVSWLHDWDADDIRHTEGTSKNIYLQNYVETADGHAKGVYDALGGARRFYAVTKKMHSPWVCSDNEQEEESCEADYEVDPRDDGGEDCFIAWNSDGLSTFGAPITDTYWENDHDRWRQDFQRSFLTRFEGDIPQAHCYTEASPGWFGNGWDTVWSYAFATAYERHGASVGCGEAFKESHHLATVHDWDGTEVQNFTGGNLGDLLLMANHTNGEVYVIRGGIWNNYDRSRYGIPFGDEIDTTTHNGGLIGYDPFFDSNEDGIVDAKERSSAVIQYCGPDATSIQRFEELAACWDKNGIATRPSIGIIQSIPSDPQDPDPEPTPPPIPNPSLADQYLFYDISRDELADVCYRQGSLISCETGANGIHDGITDVAINFGDGVSGEYSTPAWLLFVRYGNDVYVDYDHSGGGSDDNFQTIGDGFSADQYLLYGNDVFMVTGNRVDWNYGWGSNISGTFFIQVPFENILVGDFMVDGRPDLIYVHGNRLHLDWDMDGNPDYSFSFGDPLLPENYFIGDVNGDQQDDILIQRGSCFFGTLNLDSWASYNVCYGPGLQEYLRNPAYDFYPEDNDSDGAYYNLGDCNDGDRNRRPNVGDPADHVDNDCDGEVDEDSSLPLLQETGYIFPDTNKDGRADICAQVGDTFLCEETYSSTKDDIPDFITWYGDGWSPYSSTGNGVSVHFGTTRYMDTDADTLTDKVETLPQSSCDSTLTWKHVWGCRQGNKVSVDMDGNGTTERTIYYGGGTNEEIYALADFDGDGTPSVVVYAKNSNRFSIATWSQSEEFWVVFGVPSVDTFAFADMSGDGKDDIIARRSNQFRILTRVMENKNMDVGLDESKGDILRMYGRVD